jgi:ferredoxin
MRVTLDADACVGHGRCYALAPEVFGADDQGHCIIKPEGGLVPAGLEDRTRQAVANCPEGALTANESKPGAGLSTET